MIIRHERRAVIALVVVSMALSIVSGCASRAAGSSSGAAAPTVMPSATTRPIRPALTPSPTPAQAVVLHLWVSPALPQAAAVQVDLPKTMQRVLDRSSANLWLEPGASASTQEKTIAQSDWIYALVAPFPTITDAVTAEEIQTTWKGSRANDFAGKPLLMTAETRAALESLWGPANPRGVKVVDASALLDTAWNDQPAWAIVPFGDIEPRWKVLRVDGQSPLERSFDVSHYPLALPIRLDGTPAAAKALTTSISLPNNRDPNKLTVLMMTGTTAISRHIAERMEAKGMTYPAQKIGSWLSSADLTHISNEVSFYKDCPKPGPDRADMRFCSSPNYIKLLEAVGTDIIELTGNHNLDWGTQPFLDSLAMYQQRGWKTYGGGATLQDALKPLLIENHGNKLAFIGCSPAGPAPVWATTDKPGSAPCDYNKMEQEIQNLRAEGYLPIVTFQAVETDTYKPAVAQGMPNFDRMAKAGAVIVSGSQSHVPQTMTLINNGGNEGISFVHYGLGNLFFDQMDPIETRQEFVDQHVFYDGKYLGVQLLTALLEDYAQPRPMTTSERMEFLQTIFGLCDWNQK